MATRDAPAVMSTLALRTVLPANWCSGLRDAAEVGAFVTPAVAGHVLVCGSDLHLSNADAASGLVPRLERLSARFGRAAWFVADDRAEVHGWMLAERGELVRGYVFAAAAGPVYSHGEVTAEEHALGCFVDDPRDQSDDDVKWWPDSHTTCALAAAWSVDPRRLAEVAPNPSAGWVGRL